MTTARITRAPDEPPAAVGWVRAASRARFDGESAVPLLSAVIHALDRRLAQIESGIDAALVARDIETARVLIDRWTVLSDRRNELLDGI